jgi:hypothetical protein
MKYISCIAFILLAGCSLFGKRDGIKDYGEPTSAGFRVIYEDQGSVATGRLTKAEIFALFDQAQAKSARELITGHGVSAGTFDLYARKSTKYKLIDNKNFAIDASNTGFASGVSYGNIIWVCLYSRKVVDRPDQIPEGTPAWTIVEFAVNNVQKWSYGWLDPANPFPALTHELGHRILPNEFHHD